MNRILTAPKFLLPLAFLLLQGASVAATLTPSFTFASVGTSGNFRAITYDGSSYWTGGTNTNGSYNLVQYSSTGTVLNTYLEPFPIRGLAANPAGELFAINSGLQVLKMTSPGVFTSVATISGGALADLNDRITLNANGTEWVALNSSNGVVQRWDTNGTFLGTTTLIGFGSQPNETTFPAAKTLAAGPNGYYTYSASAVVSTWDFSGNRVRQDTLSPGYTGFDGNFVFSYTNGMFFTVSANASGTFTGFDAPVPEPGTLVLLSGAFGALLLYRRKHSSR